MRHVCLYMHVAEQTTYSCWSLNDAHLDSHTGERQRLYK